MSHKGTPDLLILYRDEKTAEQSWCLHGDCEEANEEFKAMSKKQPNIEEVARIWIHQPKAEVEWFSP